MNATTARDISTLSRAGARADVPRPRMRWMTRVVLPLAMLAGAGLLLAYAARGALTPAVEVRVVPVVVKAGGTHDAEGTSAPGGDAGGTPAPRGGGTIVQAPGWIEPDPFAVGVPVLIDGVLKEVLVLEGERVDAGQVVARLVDDDLRLAERTARAMVGEREAELSRARAALESARAQERVQRAMLDEMSDELARKQKLVEAGGVSAGAVRRLEIRVGGLEASSMQTASATAEAEAMVRLAGAMVETAAAAHAEASLRLERAEVRAPVSGVVMARLVSPGSRAMMQGEPAGGNVVKLYNPARLQARVDVPLADAAKIGIGTTAQVTTEALPNRTFAAVVTRVVHEANIQRNTVQFKVAIENPSDQLKPEMLCRVRFAVGAGDSGGTGEGVGVGAGDEVLLLPGAAVRERTREGSGERGMVWLVRHGSRGGEMVASRVSVRLGGIEEGSIVVLEGVRPGDRAVVDPPAGLRDGARVRIIGEAEEVAS
jgi:HlyD family secretion protein